MLAVTTIDSALKRAGNYYLQVFLKECKYIEKEVIRLITEDIEVFSSDSEYFFFNNTYRENCVLLNSVPEFTEIEAWLLLTLFLCLLYQSINWYCHILKSADVYKIDSSNRQK